MKNSNMFVLQKIKPVFKSDFNVPIPLAAIPMST
jgi:hypothetical protein